MKSPACEHSRHRTGTAAPVLLAALSSDGCACFFALLIMYHVFLCRYGFRYQMHVAEISGQNIYGSFNFFSVQVHVSLDSQGTEGFIQQTGQVREPYIVQSETLEHRVGICKVFQAFVELLAGEVAQCPCHLHPCQLGGGRGACTCQIRA